MKINVTQLLLIFDDLLPLTNEEEGVYWLRTIREDKLIITFLVSIYECKLAVSLYDSSQAPLTSLYFDHCLEVNVLDEKKKNLEILQGLGRGRCFLCLLGNPILEYKDTFQERL